MLRSPFLAVVVHGLCNLLGITVGAGYLVVVFHDAPGDARSGEVMLWVLLTVSTVYLTVSSVLALQVWPIHRALQGGDEAKRRAGAHRALELPVRFAGLSVVVWLTSGLTIYPFAAWRHADDLPTARIALSTLTVGLIASTIVFYGVEWFSRRALVPRLLQPGDLPGLGRVRTLSLRGKLAVLAVTGTVIPVIALAFTARSEFGGGPLVLGYVAAAMLGLNFLQVRLITSSVVGPLGDLGRQMKRVQADDLSARLPVRSADDVGVLAVGFNAMVDGLARGEEVRATFGRYVSPRVMEKILSGQVAQDGEVRVATVLFVDLRGFTAMSETRSARDVVKVLNRYLDVLVEAVVANGGVVDKFIGDAVMAAFGAPVSQGDDSLNAVRAAMAMVQGVEALRATQLAQGEPAMDIGVGIHTGEVLAGNVGSARQLQYTLIGDTVNTASRIEQLTKALEARVLVSEATWQAVEGRVVGRAREPVEVKGKHQKLVVYEVTGLA